MKNDHYIIVGMAADKEGRHEAYHHKGQKKGEEDFVQVRVIDIKNKTDKYYHKLMRNDDELTRYFIWDKKSRDKYGNIMGERDTCEGFKINQDAGISDEDAITILVDRINEDLGGKAKVRQEFKPRNNGQRDCLQRLKEFKDSDSDKLLINAVPRFGKTATVLAGLATDNSNFKADKILILTSKPTDTRESWTSEIAKFTFGKDYINYDINTIKTSKDLTSNKFTLFMSLQSLGRKSVNEAEEYDEFEEVEAVEELTKEEKKEANSELREFRKNQKKIDDFDFDVLLIDECHFGVDTRISQEILKSISYKKKVEISGTPFRKIQSGQYDKSDIFSYTLLDDYNENHTKDDYVKMNIVSYDADALKREKLMRGSYDRMKQDQFDKLIETFESNSFSYDAFFKTADDYQIRMFADSLINPYNNRFMKAHDITNVMVCVSQIKFAERLREELEKVKIKTIMLTGNRTSGTLKEVNEELKTSKMKGEAVVLLTCSRWCTGVTLNYLDAFCWCTSCNSAERFLQYSMRTCSKWKDDEQANKMISSHSNSHATMKHNGWVFCFQNGQAIDVRNQVIRYMSSISKKASGNATEIKKYADVVPIWRAYEDEEGSGEYSFKTIGEEETVHAYDDYMVNKLDDRDYAEYFTADFDFDEFDIDYTDENNPSLKKELFAADKRIEKAHVLSREAWKKEQEESNEDKEKRITSFVKFLSAIKKIPYLMFDESTELDTKDGKSFVNLFDSDDAKLLTGIDKATADTIVRSGAIRDKNALFQQFNLVKRALDSKNKNEEDVWNNFAEKHLKTGIDGRTGKKEKYTYADVIPQMYENEKLDGKKVIIISNGKISSVHKDIEKKAKDVTHLVIFDRDNPANKFICDREAKALGLKGPVDFIEGEDGCDKRIEEYMKNKAHIAESSGDKKAFDVCIMNPPYDRNLHLKILEKVIPYAEETINISPIRWLQDPLAKYKKNSDYNKFKESVAEHIVSMTEIEQRNASNMFNAEFGTKVGIIKIDPFKKYDFIKFNKLHDKIFSKITEEKNYSKQNKKNYSDDLDGFYVCVNSFAPPLKYGKPMFYTLKQIGVLSKNNNYREAKKNLKGATRGDVENTICIVFDNKEYAQNCYDAFKTTFAKYVTSTAITGLSIDQSTLPWMSDYTHPWDNKRFCDYFNITGYISDTEAEPDSEWEEILKTMEKYK